MRLAPETSKGKYRLVGNITWSGGAEGGGLGPGIKKNELCKLFI